MEEITRDTNIVKYNVAIGSSELNQKKVIKRKDEYKNMFELDQKTIHTGTQC